MFFKKLEREGEGGETVSIPMLRTYNVFNADQVDGLPAKYASAPIVPAAGLTRDQDKENALRSCGATIVEGGAGASYSPALDMVRMPDFERFATGGDYLATLAHELCHWTGHKARLDRTFGKTFGSADYAKEELVAELGAAFIGARLGIIGDHIESHASYLHHWLTELAGDKRLIFRAASLAQAAADLVLANAAHIAPAIASEAAAAPIPAPAPAPAAIKQPEPAAARQLAFL